MFLFVFLLLLLKLHDANDDSSVPMFVMGLTLKRLGVFDESQVTRVACVEVRSASRSTFQTSCIITLMDETDEGTYFPHAQRITL